MMNEEIWKDFDTGNFVAPDYEASSLGRVRNKLTKEIIQPDEGRKDVSPHVAILVGVHKFYWSPKVIVNAVFGDARKPVKTEKVKPTNWDKSSVAQRENRFKKRGYKPE